MNAFTWRVAYQVAIHFPLTLVYLAEAECPEDITVWRLAWFHLIYSPDAVCRILRVSLLGLTELCLQSRKDSKRDALVNPD